VSPDDDRAVRPDITPSLVLIGFQSPSTAGFRDGY
jgi:hypothetical protein